MICDLIWGYALDCILIGHSDLPTLKKPLTCGSRPKKMATSKQSTLVQQGWILLVFQTKIQFWTPSTIMTFKEYGNIWILKELFQPTEEKGL